MHYTDEPIDFNELLEGYSKYLSPQFPIDDLVGAMNYNPIINLSEEFNQFYRNNFDGFEKLKSASEAVYKANENPFTEFSENIQNLIKNSGMKKVQDNLSALEGIQISVFDLIQESAIENVKTLIEVVSEVVESPDFNAEKFDKVASLIGESKEKFKSVDELESYVDKNLDDRDRFTEDELEAFKPVQEKKVENLLSTILNWTNRHETLTSVMLFVVIYILLSPMQADLVGPVHTLSVSKIRKAANKKSENIFTIDKDKEVYVIGDEPYYYKIIYYDDKGDLKDGFIAKRNVKVLKENK